MAAQGPSESQARQALEKLCLAYWRPLYVFVRSRGYDPDAAADMTQAFFAQFLEKQYVRDVSEDKGRFRSFLLVAIKHFLANVHEKAGALKRGGAIQHASFEVQDGESWYVREPGHNATPDRIYERAWATTILERSLERLSRRYGQEEFDKFRPFLTLEQERGDYEQIAAGMGMQTGALKVAIHRLRKAYRDAIRKEIAETVADAGTVDDELRYLVSVLRDEG